MSGLDKVGYIFRMVGVIGCLTCLGLMLIMFLSLTVGFGSEVYKTILFDDMPIVIVIILVTYLIGEVISFVITWMGARESEDKNHE